MSAKAKKDQAIDYDRRLQAAIGVERGHQPNRDQTEKFSLIP